MINRLFLVASLLAALSASAYAQGQPNSFSSAGSRAPAEDVPIQSQGRMSLIGFVVSSAYAAGAVGACEAPSALAIRDCVQSLIPSWSDLTRQPPVDPKLLDAIPIIWKDAFEKARAMQTVDAPMSCDHVIAQARSMTIWRYCSAPWR